MGLVVIDSRPSARVTAVSRRAPKVELVFIDSILSMGIVAVTKVFQTEAAPLQTCPGRYHGIDGGWFWDDRHRMYSEHNIEDIWFR